MKKENCIVLGYIAKAHALNGTVKAVFDVHDIGEYLDVKSLYLAKKDETLTLYEVKSFQVSTQKFAHLKFASISDRIKAESLVGSTIYFPIEALPELKDGHFYYFQVIGFQVMDEELGELGTVSDFADGPSNDIMIMHYKGREVLIPMHEEFVGKADFETKKVFTKLPEGLLDIYLE